jgi:hypothetical protein
MATTVPNAAARVFFSRSARDECRFPRFSPHCRLTFFPAEKFCGKKIYSGWKQTLQRTGTRGILKKSGP